MSLERELLSFALLGAGWVLWLLVLLSVACLAVAIERWIFLRLQETDGKKLQGSLQRFMQTGDRPGFQKDLDGMDGCKARVLAAGIEAAAEGNAGAGEAMDGTLVFERLQLEKRLIVLGTVGSNAPFIGLFGTVLGIIKAFHDLAQHEAEAASAVMAGISEALVATAIGLMVAIPAVVLYNYFQRRVRAIVGETESLSQLVLARLKSTEFSGADSPRAELVKA
jgi:biopolymer transport protein ExbB/TolQ